MNGRHIVLAGGSGFLGRSLTQTLLQGGARVTVLSRSTGVKSRHNVTTVSWDGCSLGSWAEVLEGADAVVNFAGKNVNCRLTEQNEFELLASRLNAVNVLGEAINRCRQTPGVLIHCSAVGFYGDTARSCDEQATSGTGRLADITRVCEAAFHDAPMPGVRKVVLRLGVVLGREGGALPVLARLTRCFLGGAVGNGRQQVSWIHERDLNRIILEALENPGFEGVFNAVAPLSVTNAELMKTLRRIMRRPWCPPVPAVVMRVMGYVLGLNSELVMTGQPCVPARLQQKGFQFDFEELEPALSDLINRERVMNVCEQ